MTFTYTRANLISRVNRAVHNKQGMFIDINETCNDAVRRVAADLDLRTTRRRATLTPGLFEEEFEYACPTDLKAYSIIDLIQQAGRADKEFNLVPSEIFRRDKKASDVSIDDYNGSRILLVNSIVDSQSLTVSELDSLTSGGGTWQVVGDATNLDVDTDDYFSGSASLKFNITTGNTTAGIKNTSLNSFDFNEYVGGSSAVFVRTKINSTTDISSFTLKIGSSTSNYYSKTVTSKNDGTAFTSGWNILRFDLSSLTTTGSPNLDAFTYCEIVMNKTTTKTATSDYKFDIIVAKKGKNTDIAYYSKFGWQNTSGAYLENSTSNSDYLVADTDEYDVVTKAAISIAKRELNYPQADIDDADKEYVEAVKMYMLKNPSEAKVVGYDYYNYG